MPADYRDHIALDLKKQRKQIANMQEQTERLQTDVLYKVKLHFKAIEQYSLAQEVLEKKIPMLIDQYEARIAELEARLADYEEQALFVEAEDPLLTKASTIAIFDSILFAIENWSTDGDTAPDFSLACQAILFPLVYDQVMNGNEHYHLKRVPDAALEVVKRGREYIKFIRSVCPVGLTEAQAWTNHIPMISKWWINDALPLLYGARDPAWESNSILSLEDIMVWRDQPASRALKFPLIFDAMDLVDRYGESIRETSGLPKFTLDTLNTRLETN